MNGEVVFCALAGSLRATSMNRSLIAAATEVAPEGVRVEPFDIGGMPLFNADLETGGDPEPVAAFKSAIAEADAMLIAVPVYNFSIPGVLKNAVDWASRKRPGAERSVLYHKPVGLMGAGGSAGTSRSQLALRQVLTLPEAYVMPGPQLFLFHAHAYFDAEGRLADEVVREQVRAHLVALREWTQLVSPA
jgi:chromate reductase